MDAASTRTLGGWNAVKGQLTCTRDERDTDCEGLKMEKRRKESCFRILVLFISLFADDFPATCRLLYEVQSKTRVNMGWDVCRKNCYCRIYIYIYMPLKQSVELCYCTDCQEETSASEPTRGTLHHEAAAF